MITYCACRTKAEACSRMRAEPMARLCCWSHRWTSEFTTHGRRLCALRPALSATFDQYLRHRNGEENSSAHACAPDPCRLGPGRRGGLEPGAERLVALLGRGSVEVSI